MTNKYFFGLAPEIQENVLISLSLNDILQICNVLHHPRTIFLQTIPIVKELLDLIDQKSCLDEKINLVKIPIQKRYIILILNKLVQDEMKNLSRYNERCRHTEILQDGLESDFTEQIKIACQNLSQVYRLRSLHEMDRVASNSSGHKNKIVYAVFVLFTLLLVFSSYPFFLFLLITVAKVLSTKSLILIFYSIVMPLVYCGLIMLLQKGYGKLFDKSKQHNVLIASFYNHAGDITTLSNATKNAGFFSYDQASRRALSRMHHALNLINP